ncbi:MAG: RhuM family protein, partial [Alphaproteobacteria bacterium]
EDLGGIVNAYLELAENRAKRHIPMTMEDWAKHLDKILTADDRELLEGKGTIKKEIAKQYAEDEYEKYRPIQDKMFKSDFDKETKKIESEISKKDD